MFDESDGREEANRGSKVDLFEEEESVEMESESKRERMVEREKQ